MTKLLRNATVTRLQLCCVCCAESSLHACQYDSAVGHSRDNLTDGASLPQILHYAYCSAGMQSCVSIDK